MKIIKKTVCLFALIGLIYGIFIFFLLLSGTKDQPQTDADTLLILGAQVKGKTKKEAYPSAVLKERLDTALLYAKQNKQTILIVCGGKGVDEPESEATVMAHYLEKNGIHSQRILLETRSSRTKENLQQARKKRPLGKTVIATSDFHLYRAKLLAKRLGITKVSGLPAVSRSSSTVQNYLREILALGYGLLFDW